VITAIDDATQQKAYANLTFRIAPDTETTDVWTAYEATADPRRGRAIDDYKRGLSAAMQGSTEGAITWFERSVTDDPRYVPALARLVDLLAQSGRSKDLAALTAKVEMTHQVSQETAIQLSQANAQVGDFPQAAKILEYEMQFQPPSSELYLALADVYQRQGNVAKAEDFKRQAAKLSN
jgi:Tfp pilus assembly protein PilF